MKGEFSRLSFDRRNHYAGVLQQQGRVGLDSDWNEWVEIQLHRLRVLTEDTVGACGRPEHDPGFEISVDTGISPPDLLISDGRLYAGGLVAESESPGKQGTRFSAQPDWPVGTEAAWTALFPQGPAWPGLDLSATASGAPLTQLIYAEVWLQHLTALNDEAARDEAYLDAAGNPDWTVRPEVGDYMRERALGGPDTCTRLRTVAQVKHWDNLSDNIQTCDQACAALRQAVPPGTAGTMLLDVVPTPPVTDPCQEPLQGGYGGAWNRTYRVEIHDGGAAGTATFKWSTENGSFAVRIAGTALTSITAGSDIVVTSIGNDQETQLSANDWVEVCGQETELGVFRNALAQVKATPVANVDGTWTIQLTGGAVIPHAPFLRLWSANTQIVTLNQPFNLDAGSGLGVTFFDAAGATTGGTYFHSQDYWTWSTRVDIRAVEPESLSHVAQPPQGIERHYCCLALLTWQNQNGTTVNTSNEQCTPVFPPLTELQGEGCGCSVCVTADSHNGGILTIQSAISQVQAKGGGKVCLGPGVYNIASTITISAATAIEISGQGLPNLAATGTFGSLQPILLIENSTDVGVNGVQFFGPAANPNTLPIPGVLVANSSYVRLERCTFTSPVPPAPPAPSFKQEAIKPEATSGPSPGGTLSAAIAVSGFALELQVLNNLFSNVQIGVGQALIDGAKISLLSTSSIRNNLMSCTVAGMAFDSTGAFSWVTFADNLVIAPAGFVLQGTGLYVSVERNYLSFTGAQAIVCGASQSRIADNYIVSDTSDPGMDGIFLNSTAAILDLHVTGNFLSGLAGSGIVVGTGTILSSVVISQNRMTNLGGPGVLAFSATYVSDADITHNVMTTVGQNVQIVLPSTTTGGSAILGGILLLASIDNNVRICENVIEWVGPTTGNPAQGTWVTGIFVTSGVDLRVTGNRVLDVAAASAVTLGAGIVIQSVAGRVDVVDNEVIRASTRTDSGDRSEWYALLILTVGDANIRGNLFESFGGTSTVSGRADTLLLCDNQCFLLNNFVAGVSGAPVPVVDVGTNGALIASNNLLKGAIVQGQPAMELNPGTALTVLGNIVNGQITVGSVPIGAPWAALNAMNS